MARRAMHLKIVARDQLLGPLPLERLVEMAAAGQISPEDLVRPGGSRAWIRVTEVPELAARLPRPPAPEPPWTEAEDDPAQAREAGDPIRLGRRRRHEEAAMEMAPMIDVTFLLLIFFMLTNSMANPTPMDVPKAVHGQGVPMENQLLILVDQDGSYYLGEAANEQSAASLDALVQQVGKNVQASRETLDVIVSAHRHSKHRYVRELLQRLDTVDGLGEIRLGVEEKLD